MGQLVPGMCQVNTVLLLWADMILCKGQTRSGLLAFAKIPQGWFCAVRTHERIIAHIAVVEVSRSMASDLELCVRHTDVKKNLLVNPEFKSSGVLRNRGLLHVNRIPLGCFRTIDEARFIPLSRDPGFNRQRLSMTRIEEDHQLHAEQSLHVQLAR